jgi:hypothetical protein
MKTLISSSTRTSSRKLSRTMFWLLILAGIGASTGSLDAQRYLGGISGTVADQTGAILPDAHVMAVENSTDFKTEVIAGADGVYSMPTLPPGTYSVSVTAKGFKTETKTNIILTAGQVAQIDFSMSPGSVNQTVEVAAET